MSHSPKEFIESARKRRKFTILLTVLVFFVLYQNQCHSWLAQESRGACQRTPGSSQA